ncbi:SMI1/KNR4 family protein [Pseudomonas cichorii]|uniref:SMI1/KNR4 family protein n=1 Tax=Pseudomonas cichorii TaxID=36746 RepID=UPI001C8820EB|nr:SMI1/KNR4 family protein [Pseudomonas cichorii]MBX8489048.1 SMI1/KNR4 family protein [Pseudomonas cichorii]MBX8542643.1 SMI1/KNR4 family protein [Pseudomonas cichorii]MBX8557833.1 SMI1/KNR4 family protein [Pseudomonas cichorii]MBX8561205.1 SMI1/KNR4 family protein [Pseudomonas cichorii]MBX8576758.1 SMI1/KNR4 family protein [Pseudomonas cichorii]
MINDLCELVAYSERVAQKFPSIAAEIKLCEPGVSDSDLATLVKSVPSLPDGYLNVIKQIKVFGVSIGRLTLWPVPFDRSDLVVSLLEANSSSSNPWLGFYDSNNVVEVARIESNIICLGRKPGEHEGVAYFFDVSSGPDVVLKKVANSFEQLLVIAGNMHDVVLNFEDDEDNGRKEFLSRLRKLGVGKDLFIVWSALLDEELI